MKIFGILMTFAFAAYFTPVEAHIQYNSPSIKKADEKIYVSPENLYFGEEGIFWQTSPNCWLPITGIDTDAGGVYLTGGRVISWGYYVCTTCGRRYKSQPISCDDCGNTSFDFEYEDIWDRNN